MGRKTLTRRGVMIGMDAVGGLPGGRPRRNAVCARSDRIRRSADAAGIRRRIPPGVWPAPGYRLNHSIRCRRDRLLREQWRRCGTHQRRSDPQWSHSATGPVLAVGGNPNISDAAGVARGLGLAIGYPGQQQWRTGMLNLPVFLDNSPEGFYDRLLASKNDPATGKPDPAAMKEGQSQVRSELGNRAATPTVAARSSVHPRKRSPADLPRVGCSRARRAGGGCCTYVGNRVSTSAMFADARRMLFGVRCSLGSRAVSVARRRRESSTSIAIFAFRSGWASRCSDTGSRGMSKLRRGCKIGHCVELAGLASEVAGGH